MPVAAGAFKGTPMGVDRWAIHGGRRSAGAGRRPPEAASDGGWNGRNDAPWICGWKYRSANTPRKNQSARINANLLELEPLFQPFFRTPPPAFQASDRSWKYLAYYQLRLYVTDSKHNDYLSFGRKDIPRLHGKLANLVG